MSRLREAARVLLAGSWREQGRAAVEMIPRVHLDALRAALDAQDEAPAEMRWVPVSEGLPGRSGTYLVFGTNSRDVEAAWHSSRGVWLDAAHDYDIDGVTHWTHLPAPPSQAVAGPSGTDPSRDLPGEAETESKGRNEP